MRKADTKEAASGNGSVTCAVCGKYTGHILLPHLRDEHKLTAVEYAKKHPGSPVFSDIGSKLLKARLGDAESLAVPERDQELVTVEELMGPAFSGCKVQVRRFLGSAPYIPNGTDEHYIYDYNAVMALLMAFERKERNSIWIQGPSRSGKSQLVKNMCRRLGRECFRLNCDKGIGRPETLGGWTLVGNETVFRYGVLPMAMMRGAVLLLDEFDLANPDLAATFRPVLEENPQLVMLEVGGEVIVAHPDFRVVVTANTWGAGDETGLYGTTQSLSFADRQRFCLYVKLDYLPEEQEIELVRSVVDDLEEDEARGMVRVVGSIRKLYKEGKIDEPVSTQQLMNWAEVFSETGSAIAAATLSFLAPFNESSQRAIEELIEQAGLVKKEDPHA